MKLHDQGNGFALGLWDDTPPVFDHKTASEAARAAKREGMTRAEQHANDDWKLAAYYAVLAVAGSYDEFTSDDVMDHIPDKYQTHERRALGGVMLKVAKEGLIVKTGMVRNSTRRSLHASPRTIWTRTIR